RSERMWRGRPSVCVNWYLHLEDSQKILALAPEKQMTFGLAWLPEAEAWALLEALVDGDGHRRLDGRSCIIQKNRQSLDLMQLLAMRLGYRTVLTSRTGGTFTLYLTRGDWLTLRGTNGT